ncbi:MAG: DUF479 domain-containing protein [Gammaproteobacteria bacterium]|nr:MAG: DUF479 domain-containing protein [Gammaproteobacteria bacterium]RLA52813.1 MAG: DUF479 domain-containing protein [Gammaproteobacteria bacterium]
MNYLAHLLLSGSNLDMQVGGLLGDFVKGPLTEAYPLPIEQGIHLHRQIDTLTGRLPQITRLFTLFEEPWRRYAGIVVDIAFDHLLAQRWHQYHPMPLAEFCNTFYRHLHSRRPLLPERARHFSEIAPQIRWLESYIDPELMPTILQRIGQKFRRPIALDEAWHTVTVNYGCFEQAFDPAMTELTIFAKNYIAASQIPVGSSLPLREGKQSEL